MLIRQSVEHCIEAASLDRHSSGIWQQMHQHGEGAKAIALTRILPKALLQTLSSRSRSLNTPFNPRMVESEAFDYGSEALVYKAVSVDGTRLVVKKFRSYLPLQQHLEKRVATYMQYVHSFGSLVLPTYFLVAEGSVPKKEPIVMGVQPEVHGCKFSDSDLTINASVTTMLLEGVATMLNEYGVLPDFNNNNILVDDEGAIHIIDTGNVHRSEHQHALEEAGVLS